MQFESYGCIISNKYKVKGKLRFFCARMRVCMCVYCYDVFHMCVTLCLDVWMCTCMHTANRAAWCDVVSS